MAKTSRKKGIPIRIKESPVVFGSSGVRIRGKVLFPHSPDVSLPVPGVVLCHGFAADYRVMEPSARILTNRGIATLVFDFRGHGISDGVVDDKVVEDVVDAGSFLAEFPGVDKKEMGLVGHSFGAMSAIMAARKMGDVRALVALACPPGVNAGLFTNESLNSKPWLQEDSISEYPRHGAFPWLTGLSAFFSRAWMHLHNYQVRVNWRKFFQALPEQRISEVLRSLEGCAKLFVFCEGDKVTPYQQSVLAFEAACEPKEVLLSKGGFHTTPLLPGNLRSQWTNWVVATLMSDGTSGGR